MKFQKAEEFAEQYQKNSRTDFHQMAADIVGVPRKQAKNINLGLFYGMGTKKLANQLDLPYEEARELFAEYHSKLPFVKELAEYSNNRASHKGVIRTLLGRKCRFDKWEPNKYGISKPLSYQEAFAEHGPSIRRAFTYKALNKIIQGSAADMTKKAMADLHDEGIVPHIQVHDELDCSFEDEVEKDRILEIMRNAVQLEVPVKLDVEEGPSWGKAQ